MSAPPIHIRSEIGPLKRVLLHRPGRELENLMPEYIGRLLFDDIPYLKIAQEEHDAFCNLLRQNGVEVVYLTDLAAESLSDPDIKAQFIREYLSEAGILGEKRTAMMTEHFLALSTKNMVDKMMEGVRKSEIRGYGRKNLTDYLDDYYPFVLDPIPNLYFTRDPFAAIGSGVSIHRMSTVTRARFRDTAVPAIFPKARTVIGAAFRVLRGSHRGVEEGSTYYQYTTTGVETIEETVMPLAMLRACAVLEDAGFDALPQKRNQLIMQSCDDSCLNHSRETGVSG